MSKILDVFYNDRLSGTLRMNDHGRLEFAYARDWRQPLSQSLPLQDEPFKAKQCRSFFAGVLPEHSTRAWIAKHFGISQYNDLALLDRLAGDCAGAITLLPPGTAPAAPEYRPLSERELAEVLDVLYSKPLLVGAENLRQTLAGMQDKVAVAVIDGAICLPLNGSPSSHILKPASLRFGGIVQNEAFCMRLAAAIGLPVAPVEACRAGSIEYSP